MRNSERKFLTNQQRNLQNLGTFNNVPAKKINYKWWTELAQRRETQMAGMGKKKIGGGNEMDNEEERVCKVVVEGNLIDPYRFSLWCKIAGVMAKAIRLVWKLKKKETSTLIQYSATCSWQRGISW